MGPHAGVQCFRDELPLGHDLHGPLPEVESPAQLAIPLGTNGTEAEDVADVRSAFHQDRGYRQILGIGRLDRGAESDRRQPDVAHKFAVTCHDGASLELEVKVNM